MDGENAVVGLGGGEAIDAFVEVAFGEIRELAGTFFVVGRRGVAAADDAERADGDARAAACE